MDLVLVMWGYEFLEEHFNYYNRAKIALLLMDEPYKVDHTQIISRNYDFVLNYEQTTLPFHQNCYYLPFAYDSLGLQDIAQEATPPAYDVCFWGSKFPQEPDYWQEYGTKQPCGLRSNWAVLSRTDTPTEPTTQWPNERASI